MASVYTVSDLIEPNSRPELRAPPPLTPEGRVVTPEPEKSFIQKYWVYILAFMIIISQSRSPLLTGRRLTRGNRSHGTFSP
jgi:hypothetical protein